MNLFQLIHAIYCEPWVISPEIHSRICRLFEQRFIQDGPMRDAEDICGEKVEVPQMQITDGIATIPINGVIAKGLTKWQRGSGAVDANDISNELEHCFSNDSVKGILLDIDSPGGTVGGTPEIAELLLTKPKPCFAYGSGTVASAAYWIASQCNEIWSSHGSTIGSIGVYMAVLDESRRLEEEGISVDVISSGKFKGAGLPFKPLTEAQREQLQYQVNQIASAFKTSVKSFREIEDEDMQGQTFFGNDLIQKKFIDGFASRGAVIEKLKRKVNL